jgi:flagellar biosynthesis GTPase FlhF
MAQPTASSDSNKRKRSGDDSSTAFVDLCDLSEHEDRKPRLNSDGEISEGDEDMIYDEPYNEAQEDYPERPAFSQALRVLCDDTMHLTRQLQDAMNRHSSASEHLRNLLLKADEAVVPPTPERLMVAMVGATGAGKIPILLSMTPS